MTIRENTNFEPYISCSLIIQKCNDSPGARFPIMYLRITKRKGHKSTCNFTKIANYVPPLILLFSFLIWTFTNCDLTREPFQQKRDFCFRVKWNYHKIRTMQSSSMFSIEINLQFLRICSITRYSFQIIIVSLEEKKEFPRISRSIFLHFPTFLFIYFLTKELEESVHYWTSFYKLCEFSTRMEKNRWR